MDNIDALMYSIRSAVDRELEKCANDLQKKSLDLAPSASGVLRESCFVEPRHESEDVRIFVVGYDTTRVTGDNFNYAIIQHEKQMNHPHGGQWKFLEQPYKENINDYNNKVDDVVIDRLKRVSIK